VNAIQALGFRTLMLVLHLGRLGVFVGRLARASVAPPSRMRRFIAEVFDVGVLSLPIVCLSGATVGAVLGFQSYVALARFGAEGSVGAVVGIALIREFGPVLTALLVTGRAGSAMAAEIASMVQTGQIDGLRMMSIDPMHFVVMPKAWGMLFSMPLLSALFIVFAIAGGYGVVVHLLGLDPGTYITSLEDAVDFHDDVMQSLTKALVFGTLMASIATYRGYISEPTSAGVSAATTGTVVAASVTVLLFDYALTTLWGV
jgi:phospholipid/cholesterol/gamma-HCH transport system permease protein